jgi:predicted ribosome quality control (RQC) complex YloA/Tae2 family protein
MRDLYALEVIRLAAELQSLKDLYIDQFYELAKGRFRIKLSGKGEKSNLQIILPSTINRTEFIEIKEEATNFSLASRKRISGFQIKWVSQYNNDRIILIKVKKADSEINIILELFGKGNLVIADSEMKILLAYRVHEFHDRAIKPNATYIAPKNSSVDIYESSGIERIVSEIKSKKESSAILPYLTKRVAMGSLYIEEATRRANINPASKLSELEEKDVDTLFAEINKIIKDCTEKPKPVIYITDGLVTDFALCKISKYKHLQEEEFPTLENCLDHVYSRVKLEKDVINEEAERVRTSISKQSEILAQIDDEIADNKRKGTYIMSHMHEMNRIISAAESNRRIKKEEINPEIRGSEILEIDLKNKKLRIKVESD